MGTRSGTLVTAAIALAITVSLVLYPDLAFQSALRGLRIWWFIVFPALLPFFIAGQVLMALGVVRFIGVLLERFMRPCFNVPGVGAFVLSMGLASGYPIGAVLTAKLVRQKQLNVAEAERLMSFCNTADPLFMAGAVAVGMFGQPVLAGAIMATHYLAALGTGFVMRFHRREEQSADLAVRDNRGFLSRAVSALIQARDEDGRAFGQILADSVMDSIRTLLLVGGLIILFAVVLAVLGRVGFISLMTVPLGFALRPFGISIGSVHAFVAGLFEITIGTQLVARASGSLLGRLVIANMIIAWSGLSVAAQVAAVVHGTGIRLKPYLFARVLQALFAGALTFWFWNPAWAIKKAVVPAWASHSVSNLVVHLRWWGVFEWSWVLLGLMLALLVLVAFASSVLSGMRAWRLRI